MPSKQKLLNRLRKLAKSMKRLYDDAAKRQAEIRGGIEKLEEKIKEVEEKA
jgi:hypothetical protein